MPEDRRFTDVANDEPTVLGKGIHVKGEITGSASIEVWGFLEGKADTESLLWVRPGGEVGGQIEASNVVVEGQVEGRIHAADKVELRADSKVKGDVSAATLAIADGSFFQGQVHMREGKAPPQLRFKEKRKG